MIIEISAVWLHVAMFLVPVLLMVAIGLMMDAKNTVYTILAICGILVIIGMAVEAFMGIILTLNDFGIR